MSEAVKWAISQGVEIDIAPCCDKCNQIAIGVFYTVGKGAKVALMEKVPKDEIMKNLNKILDEMVSKVSAIAGIRPYVIAAGYRNN